MNKTIEELKNMPIWMLWKRHQYGNHASKKPYAADGSPCGVNDEYQDAWVTYDEAQHAAAGQQANGVGFKIPSGMFFLDIDHRDVQDPLVQEMLSLYNSYSEYSVSGEGIHIYGLCDISALPIYTDTKDGTKKLSKEFYTHHPKNGIELYVGALTNRFAVFTGNVILNQPLMDCTNAIVDTLDRYMRKKEKKSALDQKADKIIAQLRSQSKDGAFSQIFDEGKWDEKYTRLSKIPSSR